MITSNNCIQTEKITAEEIIVDNKKYYYTKNNDKLQIYEYNDLLNSYQPLKNNNIITIISNILNK
jgi:hypothetical protein